MLEKSVGELAAMFGALDEPALLDSRGRALGRQTPPPRDGKTDDE